MKKTTKKFEQLSYRERQKIYSGLCGGKSQKNIAKELERSPSTISREIARNSDQFGYLYPGDAHEMAQKRKNINLPKIDESPVLKKYIVENLKKRLSPKMIAGAWSLENPEKSICPETIYEWIYGPVGEKLALKDLLLRRHKKRGMRRKQKKPSIRNRTSIHDRPDHINQRIDLGHFEADLIFNSGSQSKNILTLIERVTRYAILIFNENKRTSTVIDALIGHITKTGMTIKSITFDNGSEFADHAKLNALGIKTFFCDPASPWQKGSIENLNGVLRRYVPFDMPANQINQDFVFEINEQVNDLPREILGFKSSKQAFMESRVKAALPAAEAFHYVSM